MAGVEHQSNCGVLRRIFATFRSLCVSTKSNPALFRRMPKLMHLPSDPGGPSVNSLQAELVKLDLVRKLGLPADLFAHAQPHQVERYSQRVAVEAPYELRRHAEPAILELGFSCMFKNCPTFSQVLAGESRS